MDGFAASRTDGAAYFVKPGYVYFTREPVTVAAVLGSSVAVCLWDRRLHIAGMNHFLFPFMRDAAQATPQYGNVATAALVRLLREAGSKPRDLMAHILGGACPGEEEDGHLGIENVGVARRVLAARRVAVASEDVGGTMGRKVILDVGTGHVAVFKVHHIRKEDWVSQR